jgi:hypothetical protein
MQHSVSKPLVSFGQVYDPVTVIPVICPPQLPMKGRSGKTN